MSPAHAVAKAKKKVPGHTKRPPPRRAPQAGTVHAWQDDPSGYPAREAPVPDLARPPLKLSIKGTPVPPGLYTPGTAEFRYWAAAEALARGASFWAPLLGVRGWQPGAVLPVGLDEGQDFNAYYDRSELAFFHGTAGGKVVYSGESPDVACHELGHACLDAHRPELWDAPYLEVGAFHESFGDMSAILSALQIDTVRRAALPALQKGQASELSRLAEQLGWAIRQQQPDAVDPDCLRNACNAFAYVDPNTLPDYAPVTGLCAEVHSFSRVFTGAFYAALSGMLQVQKDLAAAALDLAQLLVDATGAAPVDPGYFAQVAAHLIDADTARFGGKYRKPLVAAFAGRRIIPPAAVEALAPLTPKTRQQAAALALARLERPAPRSRRLELAGRDFGLQDRPLVVEAPVEVFTSHTLSAALLEQHPARDAAAEASTRRFVKALFAHGRVAVEPRHLAPGVTSPERPGRHTHAAVEVGGALRLVRRRFDCGHG